MFFLKKSKETPLKSDIFINSLSLYHQYKKPEALKCPATTLLLKNNQKEKTKHWYEKNK